MTPGRLEVLANTTGVLAGTGGQETPLADCERTLRVSVTAPLLRIKAGMRQACTGAGIDPDAPLVGIPAAAF